MDKKFIIFLILAILTVGGIAFYKTGSAPTINKDELLTASTSPDTISPKNNGIKNNTNIIDEAELKTFTASDVSVKNTQTSCFTIISGSVYDLTNWITKHPGGEKAILSICGKDSTAIFKKQHEGNKKTESVLSSFKIGTLKN